MKEKKLTNKKKVDSKISSEKKLVRKKKEAGKKKNIKPMLIVDYTFLISLVLSIILGMQTNEVIFFWPFTIALSVTVVCMCIILINAMHSKIIKKIKSNKQKKSN